MAATEDRASLVNVVTIIIVVVIIVIINNSNNTASIILTLLGSALLLGGCVARPESRVMAVNCNLKCTSTPD